MLNISKSLSILYPLQGEFNQIQERCELAENNPFCRTIMLNHVSYLLSLHSKGININIVLHISWSTIDVIVRLLLLCLVAT